jgi:hypothetical protein
MWGGGVIRSSCALPPTGRHRRWLARPPMRGGAPGGRGGRLAGGWGCSARVTVTTVATVTQGGEIIGGMSPRASQSVDEQAVDMWQAASTKQGRLALQWWNRVQNMDADEVAWRREEKEVSQNGWLLGRRGRSLPANASGLDTHRDSISSRFDCRLARPRPRRRRRRRRRWPRRRRPTRRRRRRGSRRSACAGRR